MSTRVSLDEQIDFLVGEEDRSHAWISAATPEQARRHHQSRLRILTRIRETLELLRVHEADFVAMVAAKRQAAARKRA